MSDHNQGITSPDLWIRLAYMILFWLLSFLARLAIGIIAILQFVVVLVTGAPSPALREWGRGIALWTCQNYEFLAFQSDSKPFPFQDWPAPAEVSESGQEVDKAADSEESDTDKTS
jgi:hypothetical protein